MNKNETQIDAAAVLVSSPSPLLPLTEISNGHQNTPAISNNDNIDNHDVSTMYFSDVYDLNQALNRFAEVAADPRQPVIRRAAVAEQLWKDHVNAWNNRPRDTQQQQQQSRVILARPDIVSFNTVLKAWARAAHALSLNHQLQTHDYEGTTTVTVAPATTDNAASTTIAVVDKDQEYLRRVISNNVQPHLLERYYSLDPMVPVFTAKDCAMRATNLLQQQEQKLAKIQQLQQQQQQQQQQIEDAGDDDDPSLSAPNANSNVNIVNRRLLRPDMSSYNTCLDAWAKSHAKEALPQAHALLAQMTSIQAHDKSRHLNPDIFSYNSLLDACSHYEMIMDVVDNNPSEEGSTNTMMDHRLVETLRIRRLLESSTEARLRPTIRTYNSILHVYSRVAAAATWNGKNKQAYEDEASRLGRAALELLDEVKQQSAAAAEAAAVLHEEEEEQQELLIVANNDDNDNDSEARLHNKYRARRIKPDVITYSSVMDVLSKVGKPWATNAAVDLLRELKQHPELEPTPYSYTTLISAWSRTPVPQAPQEAEALLNELLEKYWTKPNTSSSSKEFNGDKNDVGNMTPNHRPFTATLHTLARSRQGNKAVKGLELLQRMKHVARGGGDTSGENNSNSKWLFPPSRAAYHAALDCCCRTTDHRYQDAAMRIAFAIFKDMNGTTSPVSPNSVTFNKLLRCISELWPASQERNRVADVVFQKAKAAGQVDSGVLLALQKAVDAELLQTLLGSDLCNHKGSINFQRIPAAWSHHVRA
jgi:hypothetical protein